MSKSVESAKDIILSQYITDVNGQINAISKFMGQLYIKQSGIFYQKKQILQLQNKRVVVMPNYTNALIYKLASFSEFKKPGIKQIWFCFGAQGKKKYILIYLITEWFGKTNLLFLEIIILRSCDKTNSLEIKPASCKVKFELYLNNFWEDCLTERDCAEPKVIQLKRQILNQLLEHFRNVDTICTLKEK